MGRGRWLPLPSRGPNGGSATSAGGGGGFHVNFCSEQARVVLLPSPNSAAAFRIYKEDPPVLNLFKQRISWSEFGLAAVTLKSSVWKSFKSSEGPAEVGDEGPSREGLLLFRCVTSVAESGQGRCKSPLDFGVELQP